MKNLLYILFTGFLTLLCIHCITSVKKGNQGVNPGTILKSNNSGKDCLTCHKKAVNEKLSFKVAGTVYDANDKVLEGVTVALYSNADGSGNPVINLTSDQKGNFFTATPVDFGTGLYPRVISGSKIMSMKIPVTTGACNSCHNKTVRKITIF